MFRIFEILVIRTDQSVIGEAFIHKLLGFAALGVALCILRLRWRDIGFVKSKFWRGMLHGGLLGAGVFVVAYGVEILLTKSATLQFYVTSYDPTGNGVMQDGLPFVGICIIGNVVNVAMEDGVFRGLFMLSGERKHSWFKAMIFSSVLFGIWHGIMPLRNFLDGVQSGGEAVTNAVMLIAVSFVFGAELCMLCKIEGGLWAGMTLHLINNASVNLLHVAGADGVDGLQTMRIAIAQALAFTAILIAFIAKRKRTE
jgi:membrane protease YdiL (CAAX protease family)